MESSQGQQLPVLPQEATASGSGNPFLPGSPAAGQLDMAQMQMLMAQMVETAQAAAQAAQAAVARPSSSSGTAGFADANKILNRPTEFGSAVHDNDVAQWAEWSHSFRTWLVFADHEYETDLKIVEENLNTPVDLSTADAARVARSQRLFAILASVLRAKPKAILRQVSDKSGLEVWRVLTNTFAPRTKFRGLALLNALMSLPTFTKDRSLREQIQGLERVAEEYRKVTNNSPGEHVMLGTLVRCLPHALRQHVQLQMSEGITSWAMR